MNGEVKKIIFLTVGTRGDLFPYLGMAKEMKRRGYNTVIASTEAYRELCESEGVAFAPIQSAENHQAMLKHPHMWKPLRGLFLFLRNTAGGITSETYKLIEREPRDGSTVVVYNSVLFGARLATEKLGVRAINVFHIPFCRISRVDPSKNDTWINFSLKWAGPIGRRVIMHFFVGYLNFLTRHVNQIRAELGMKREKDLVGGWRQATPVNMDLWPEWFCPPKADGPKSVRHVGFIEYSGPAPKTIGWRGQEEMREFLERKPIVFTMGSEMNQNFEAQVRLFSGACRKLGRPGVLISASVRGQEPMKINDDFYVIDAPYAEIFPKASVISSHGGIGTVARVFGVGCPHLVTPLAYDHFDNGYLVEKMGAGVCIPYRALTVRKLARALDKLSTSKAIAEVCARVQPEVQQGLATERAANFIEETFQLASAPARTAQQEALAHSA